MHMRHLEWLALGVAVLLPSQAIEAQEPLDQVDAIQGEHFFPQKRALRQKEDLVLNPTLYYDESSSFSCKPYFEHATDRLAHNTHLYAGEAVCHKQFMFGVTSDGVFQWRDCLAKKTKVFYNASSSDAYFVMLEDASWNVYVKDQLKWKEKCNLDVHLHPQCLSRFNLDCPYIHLRKSGHIVLNLIDSDGSWEAIGAEQVYGSIDKEGKWDANHAYAV